MENCINNLLKTRRSIYALGDKNIDEKLVEDIVQKAVKYCPTAFNSQSARVIVLMHSQHHKFWNLVMEALRRIVPADKFAPTEAKIKSFDAAYGTILFYEDQEVIEDLQEKFSTYKDNFPKWSEQSNGMLQYIIWSALAESNIGASLQHYNPLIDQAAAQEWSIPDNWKLIAQMPFGSIEAPAGAKDFMPLEQRIKIYK